VIHVLQDGAQSIAQLRRFTLLEVIYKEARLARVVHSLVVSYSHVLPALQGDAAEKIAALILGV
jgi:hypothetical protein